MIKAYEVISAGACSTQARFSGLEMKKGRHTYNGVVIRAIMKDGMGFCEQDIRAAIDQHMNPEIFNSIRECDINSQMLVDRMMRFQKWLKNQESAHTVYVPAGEVTVQGVEVSFDLIVQNGIDVRVFKVKNKKNDELTWRGKKRIDESMEMFLLQLAGEQMFPGSSASGCIAFLRDKDDTANNFVDPINYAGVIQHHFLDAGRWAMEDRLKEILNGTMKHKCGDCSSCPYVNLCTQKAKEAPLAVVPPQPKATGPVRFTPAQMELIQAEHGVFRVLAGAGSGKTTCIANRICRLVNHCHPKKILLITYTTKGVEEMREKIQYWMTENGQTQYSIDDFNIFTFNGFGNEIIKQNYADFGFSAEPRLIEKPEEMQLIQELLDKSPEIPGYDYANPLMNFHQQFMPLESGRGVCVVMAEYFKKLKSAYCASEEDVAYLLNVPVDIAIRVFSLFQQYQDELSIRNLVDYQDQISMCYDFYSQDKNLRACGFEHIIVDEFQGATCFHISKQ